MEQRDYSSEIGIAEILKSIWNGKAVIGSAMIATLVAGLFLYVILPRFYVSAVEITPLRQPQLADYIVLSEEKVFPYTAEMLFADFIANLRDFELLAEVARTTGVVARDGLSDESFAEKVRRFVQSVEFKKEAVPASQTSIAVVMKSSAEDPKALTAFSTVALTLARQRMRDDLSAEIRNRASAIKEKNDIEIATLKVDIEAARKREESIRNDKIADLSEQMSIARALGIEKPLEMRLLDLGERGAHGSVQINSNQEQKSYLRGSAALGLEVQALEDRKNNDPYVIDLRKLQQKISILENDPRPGRILSLLKASPLNNSAAAKFARYSFSGSAAYKSFPRASIFIPASLLSGLLIGFGILTVREVFRR
ncbi:hypothetical protein ACWX0K_13160 [Nitrobacteraceae bacterium UC4446_H13]